jgi:EAL and modified HD-GYP domain-containing signal transduction protein
MEQIAGELNLSEEVQQALVSREGIYGNLLALAEALEQVDFVKASELLGALSIPYSTVMDAQMKAYNWQAGMG